MKGMASQNEASGDFGWAPPGRYPVRIQKAESTISSTNKAMIKLEMTIEGGEYDGTIVFDNIITEGGVKGAGFGKRKLRGLGINVESDAEVPDEQIANHLVGKLFYADLVCEPASKKEGNTLVPRFTLDENGNQIRAQNNRPENYYTSGVGGQPAAQPQQAARPAAPTAPAPVQQQPAQFAQFPAGAPPAPTGAAPTNGVPSWAGQPVPPQVAAPEGGAAAGGRRRPKAQQ